MALRSLGKKSCGLLLMYCPLFAQLERSAVSEESDGLNSGLVSGTSWSEQFGRVKQMELSLRRSGWTAPLMVEGGLSTCSEIHPTWAPRRVSQGTRVMEAIAMGLQLSPGEKPLPGESGE